MNQNSHLTGPSDEQVLYANILNKGMLLGLLILIVTFALYVFGIVTPFVPVEKLSAYWHLNVHDYLTALNLPDGWGWVSMLKYGDFLNFIGVALLAGVSIFCYAAIVPTLLRQGDKIYAVLAVLEVIVLLAAATGLVGGGGH